MLQHLHQHLPANRQSFAAIEMTLLIKNTSRALRRVNICLRLLSSPCSTNQSFVIRFVIQTMEKKEKTDVEKLFPGSRSIAR